MPPSCDYLLRFEPIFRRYLWGGRRLGDVLHKAIGPETDYSESWELVDHGEDQSVVQAGPLAGRTLGELVHEHGAELLGRHAPQDQFPLLLKFLDCSRTLSVQVHPNDEQGAKLHPPDCGKTEAWVVLDARPGSKIYAGLKAGVTRQSLAESLAAGRVEDALHQFEPRPGDCVFIPAGTVHALGAGLLIAEIQQASDTTFRLFDWNRVDAQGRPRELHIDQSLAVIDFASGPVPAVTPRRVGEHCERLAECDKFVIDRWTLSAAQVLGGDDRCHVLAVTAGSAEVARDPAHRPLKTGESALLPAAAGAVEVRPQGTAVVLDMYLP